MQVEGTLKMEFPGSPPFVGVARKAIEAVAFALRLPQELTNDLRLAVGEACTNAVKHADPKGHPFTVVFVVSPDSIEIEIRNKCHEFRAGNRQKKSDVHHLPIGGLGLNVIEHVMDKVEITCEGGEMILRMSKRLTD
jgi:serine/threonine-protein kinase RsbW